MEKNQQIELFQKIGLDNDQGAFLVFFKQYHSKLLRYANLFMRSMQESEDVVSEVLIRLLKNREEVFLKENFIGFLFQCIKNQCLDQIKKDKRRMSHVDNNYHEKDYFIFDNQTPFTQLVNSELHELVRNCIEGLPPKRRMVFKLVKDEQMSHKEVAALMDISYRTVEVHLKLAVKEVRGVVESYMNHSNEINPSDKLRIMRMITLMIIPVIS